MWVAQIVVNHVLCRVIDKRIPSPYCILPLNKWSSHSLCKIMQSLHFFNSEYAWKMHSIWLPQSKLRVSKSGPSANLGELQAPNSSPAWPWSKIRTVGTFKTLKGGFTGFRRGAFCNTKKNSSVFAVSKKWGSLLEPIETFTACLPKTFQTCPISNPLGRTFSQKCSSIDLET